MTREPWFPDALLTFVESVRDMGRGDLHAESMEITPRCVALEDALDIFDRQIDHVLGFIHARAANSHSLSETA